MSTTRVPKKDITGAYGTIMKAFCKRMLGRVPEPLGVYWHNPKVLKTYFALSSKMQKCDACDENLKSFAHLAVASLVGCSWCLDFGYFQAANENLDIEKAQQAPNWRQSDVFTPLERDVMEYAEAMSMTPPTVDDWMVEKLRDQLGDPALVELTAYIAIANFYTRSNVAFGIESEGFAESCQLKPLASPAGVGA